jgi:hypothetical protein
MTALGEMVEDNGEVKQSEDVLKVTSRFSGSWSFSQSRKHVLARLSTYKGINAT